MSYKIALYIRLSSEDTNKNENEQSESVQNQKDLLNNFVLSKIEFNGSTILHMVDDGYSGTNFQRPAVIELLDLAKSNKIDCIIVKDFSRFGRNYLEVSDYLDQIFPFLGVRFISINDHYDSATLNGKTGGIEVAFRNIMYSYYSKDLSKKVKSAKREKALKGDYINAFAPFGYQKLSSNRNQLIVEPVSAEIVKSIFEMAYNGMNSTTIAKVLNADKIESKSIYKNKNGIVANWFKLTDRVIWSSNNVCSILRDERYLGKVIYGKSYQPIIGVNKPKKIKRDDWIIVSDKHEPLVSIEIFNKAQSVMKTFEEKDYIGKTIHLFTKKLRCGVCFHSLTRRSEKIGKYYCYSKYIDENTKCMKNFISENDIADIVLKTIKLYIQTLLEKEQLKTKVKNPISKIENNIKVYKNAVLKCNNNKCDLYDKYANKEITKQEYILFKNKIDIEQQEFQLLVDDLSIKITNEQKYQYELSLLPQKNILKSYLTIDTITREIVETFIDCIYVYPDNSIHIKWNFEDFNKI